jgi:site-specific DNA-methyltransferase (adenine-specific)
MRELPDASVDAVVTDPPYELGFMGKSWDSSGIAFNTDVWLECLRVLKPGGHLLAFGGSRTWHRIAVAVEDAGFQIRDSVAWLYGSGFPKSLDVSKAIDKASGFEGDVIGTELVDVGMQGGHMHTGRERSIVERSIVERSIVERSIVAQKWQGWGTALKPAFEPVIVARKPLVGTVAANVLEYGTGALNIDGTRIPATDGANFKRQVNYTGLNEGWTRPYQQTEDGRQREAEQRLISEAKAESLGRWPSNVVLDEFTAGLVDEQSGLTAGGKRQVGASPRTNIGHKLSETSADRSEALVNYGDSGGASRFFYVAKASKRDRNEGLDALPVENRYKKGGVGGTGGKRDVTVAENATPVQNFHPTVKPTDLMRQLVRLVTPPGGVVLDPFTGSGSTGKAAILEGFEFIGCELTEEYLPIIEGRLNHAVATVKAEQDKEEEKLF